MLQSLRVAVILDCQRPAAWIGAVIEDLKSAGVPLRAAVLAPVQHLGRAFLLSKYLAWDSGRNRQEPDPLAPQTIAVDWVDAAEVGGWQPHLVLWMSQAALPAAPPEAEHGLWFFQFGKTGGGPPEAAYFAELAVQDPLTSVYLMRSVGPDTKPQVLAEAHTASQLGWSLRNQQSAPLWKAASLPRCCLQRLSSGSAGILPRPEPQSAGSPSNISVLGFAVNNLKRTVQRRLLYSGKEAHWFVAYRTAREQFISQAGRFSAIGFRILAAPEGHFYADPFVLTWQGRTFLFVEDYLYSEARGVLAVLEFQDDGTFGPAVEILNRPYHLSYPFVFEEGGEVFLIPETLDSGQIELYRAVQMPYRWELVKVLKENVRAVDTTLWVAGGVHYFFTNLQQPGITPNDLLFLFTADSLTGEWRPHPQNPVNLDVRSARGAGRLFHMGEKLIRPAQDCSVRYGYATQLNEVEELTPEVFREKPLFRIEPDWHPGLIGTHTINSDVALEVIDGQVYRTRYRKREEF